MINDDTTGPADRDPFGRLQADDGSRARFQRLADLFDLKGPVGAEAANDPDDVARIEMLLEQAGALDLKPSEGPTGFVGQRLIEAIAAFQKRAGLAPTGVIRPGDATLRALRALVPPSSGDPDTPADGQPAVAGPAAT